MKLKDLQVNGIFIDQVPSGDGELVPHLDKVRASLLEFTSGVKEGLADDFGYIKKFDSKALQLGDHFAALSKKCKTISAKAADIEKLDHPELEWEEFFHANLLKPLQGALRRMRTQDPP